MAAGLQVVGTATTADEVLDPASQERPASIMSSFLSKFVAIAAGDSGFSILPEEYSISNRVILTVVWPRPVPQSTDILRPARLAPTAENDSLHVAAATELSGTSNE